jgi:hypothetical protein
MLGYINYENPNYVLDLSGLSSETTRRESARERTPDWMDDLLARHDIGLALMDTTSVDAVPAKWIEVADLRPNGLLSDDAYHHFVLYARRPGDVAAIATALDRFAPTLPADIRLKRSDPSGPPNRGL